MDEQHLTVEEFAHREQISIGTVYQLNHHGTGPRYLRTGKKGGVRYRLSDIEAWEESRLVTRQTP